MAITFKHLSSLSGNYENLSSNSPFPLSEMKSVQIGGLSSTGAQNLTLSYTLPGQTAQTIFTRVYYPGLNSTIDLDIREDLLDIMKLVHIADADGYENLSYLYCTLACGNNSASFYVILQDTYGIETTDIDYLDIDASTQLRLAISNPEMTQRDDDEITGGEEDDDTPMYLMTRRGKTLIKTQNFLGAFRQPLLYCRLDVNPVDLPVKFGEPFRIVFDAISTGGQDIMSPVYCMKPGKAEHYMFLNHHGALDVIPMFGDLSFSPDYTLASGSYQESRFRLQADMDEAYVQNTGHLSRKTTAALAELLTSRQIYHRVNDVWQQIIIEETNLSLAKMEYLHSCTFKYRYADKNFKPHII